MARRRSTRSQKAISQHEGDTSGSTKGNGPPDSAEVSDLDSSKCGSKKLGKRPPDKKTGVLDRKLNRKKEQLEAVRKQLKSMKQCLNRRNKRISSQESDIRGLNSEITVLKEQEQVVLKAASTKFDTTVETLKKDFKLNSNKKMIQLRI